MVPSQLNSRLGFINPGLTLYIYILISRLIDIAWLEDLYLLFLAIVSPMFGPKNRHAGEKKTCVSCVNMGHDWVNNLYITIQHG